MSYQIIFSQIEFNDVQVSYPTILLRHIEVMCLLNQFAYRYIFKSHSDLQILLAAKLTAAVLSGSMSIISSLVDSVVDIASGLVVWVTTKAIRNANRYKYPNGKYYVQQTQINVSIQENFSINDMYTQFVLIGPQKDFKQD